MAGPIASRRPIRKRRDTGVTPTAHQTVVRTNLPRLLAETSPERPVTILDLATGSADIPVNVVRWARDQGRDVEITATDFSPDILKVAARRVAGYPNIHLLQCDAREVPFPDASFDIVLCSLALHPFPPAGAVRVLAGMDRLGRVGFRVNDLARSRPGYIGAWLVGRLATRNRITRHDAPLSALRAYTPDELRALLDRAGVKDVEVRRSPWFRMAATQIKPDSNSKEAPLRSAEASQVLAGTRS